MSDQTRDEQGRFVKGSAGGPGRYNKARELAYLAVFQEVAQLDDWRKIIAQAVRDATDPNDAKTRERGRRFLADYVIGRPKQIVQVEREPSAFDELERYNDDELRALLAAAESRPDPGGAGGAGSPAS